MLCYYSRTKLLGYLLLSILLLAAAVFCLTINQFKAQIAGYAGLAFFGLGFLVLFLRLFISRPVILITDSGLTDRRWSIPEIPWAQIESIRVETVQTRHRAHRYIAIQLFHQAHYLQSLPIHRRIHAELNRLIGYAPFLVNCHALDTDFDTVLQTIQLYLRNSINQSAHGDP